MGRAVCGAAARSGEAEARAGRYVLGRRQRLFAEPLESDRLARDAGDGLEIRATRPKEGINAEAHDAALSVLA